MRRSIAAALPAGLHPVLARIYAGRGAATRDDVDHRLARLAAPALLGGMEAAVALIVDAIDHDRPVLVVGDFDADGATGTAVALRGLRMLGLRRVSHRVPNRFVHGYGLSRALVDDIDAPHGTLIVTVDNGIASHDGVLAARAAGYGVLVTDHHLPGAVLPAADAIVNPNLAGDAFPSKALAGVGVVFYLLLAVRAALRANGRYGSAGEPELASLLDLVAIGTVADLVPLDFNNRVLVAAGLKRIRAGQMQHGVRALFRAAGRDPARADARDFGYALGPRINAAGRLEDMGIGIECLVTDDERVADALALELDRINRERRDLQAEMVAQAEALAEATDREALRAVGVCLADAGWHAGVVGLVASKLKEKLDRPVFALAPGEGGEWKGSGRSVAGFHLRDALAAIDARDPGLLLRFGGHAMAAGLSLAGDAIGRFAAAFDAEARRALGDAPDAAAILSDGALAGAEVTLALAELLADAGPWGQAFPEPQFDNVFEVRESRVVGAKHLRYVLGFAECGTVAQGIHFGGYAGQTVPARIRAAYQLGVDEFRGERRVQLLIRHVEPA